MDKLSKLTGLANLQRPFQRPQELSSPAVLEHHFEALPPCQRERGVAEASRASGFAELEQGRTDLKH